MKGASEAFLEWAIRVFLGSAEETRTEFDPEEIEQIAIGFLNDPIGDDRKKSPLPETPCILMIRATGDVDWKARMVGFAKRHIAGEVEWVRIPSEGGDYYRLQSPNPLIPSLPWRVGACLFPGHRTVVITDDERVLRERLPQFGQEEPDLARTDGWREVSDGLIAFASQPEGPVAEAADAEILSLFLFELFPPDQKLACRYFRGVGEDQEWRFRTSLRCLDGREADRMTSTLRGLLIQARFMIGFEFLKLDFGLNEECRKDFPPIVRRCFAELLQSGAIGQQGGAVEITGRFTLRLADIPKFLEACTVSAPEEAPDRVVPTFNATPGKSSR